MENYHLGICYQCSKPIYSNRISDYHGECEADYVTYHFECWENLNKGINVTT